MRFSRFTVTCFFLSKAISTPADLRISSDARSYSHSIILPPNSSTIIATGPAFDIRFLATVNRGIEHTSKKVPGRQIRLLWVQTSWTLSTSPFPAIFMIFKIMNPEDESEARYITAATGPPNISYGQWKAPVRVQKDLVRIMDLPHRPDIEWEFCTLDFPEAWRYVRSRGWNHPLTNFALVQNVESMVIAREPMYVFEGPEYQGYHQRAMIGMRTRVIDIRWAFAQSDGPDPSIVTSSVQSSMAELVSPKPLDTSDS